MPLKKGPKTPLKPVHLKKIIVIPTYNEVGNIAKIIKTIGDQKLDFHILFVDDNSPDGTSGEIQKLQKKCKEVHLLNREKKEGLGRAYVAGFDWAVKQNYDVIMQMDSDLSHDPSVLKDFVKEIQNHDAVFGSRYYKGIRIHNWSFKRLLLSLTSNKFIQFMLNLKSTDTTTAYKAYRRHVLEKIEFQNIRWNRNAFLIELVYRVEKAKFSIVEVPFIFYERETGESKMEFKVAVESLYTVFYLFFKGLFKK